MFGFQILRPTTQSAHTGYQLITTFDYATAPNSPQVLTYPSIDSINADGYDFIATGSCANVGDCYLSVSYFDALSCQSTYSIIALSVAIDEFLPHPHSGIVTIYGRRVSSSIPYPAQIIPHYPTVHPDASTLRLIGVD
jgi:hypothetical protein